MTTTAAGTYGAVMAPGPDVIRASIAAQMCPWCGAGPYRVLASHTNKAHGVGRGELRQLAGLSNNASICSPETSERARESLMERNADGSLSIKGGQAAAELGVHFVGTKARTKQLEAENQHRDAAILADYRKGLGRVEIAKRNGTGTAVVARVLAASGVVEDGRKPAAKKRQVGDRLMKASLEATERLTRQKIARYLALGGTWTAIHQVSKEYAVSAKAFAALMRKHGVHVPDGRERSGLGHR